MLQPYNFQFNIRLVIVIFLIALFSVSVGVGGGGLLVPILIWVFNFDFKKAASLSLMTIMPITFIGSISHLFLLSQKPQIQYYLLFIPACVLGTIFASKITGKYHNGFLKFLFSLFLIIISLKIFNIFDFPFFVYRGLDSIFNESLILIFIGVFIGITAFSLGVGCGLFIVPFYVIIIKLNIHQAIALSLTTMFFMALSATIIQKRLKKLDISLLQYIFLPALTGSVLGAIISAYLPTVILKQVFATFIFLIACKFMVLSFIYMPET